MNLKGLSKAAVIAESGIIPALPEWSQNNYGKPHLVSQLSGRNPKRQPPKYRFRNIYICICSVRASVHKLLHETFQI